MSRHVILALVLVFVLNPLHVWARTGDPQPSADQARSFRLKMVTDYGPATWDDLVLARQCLRCGAVTGRQTVRPTGVRPTNGAEWLSKVQDVAARSVLHRACASCGNTPAGAGFQTVLFSGMVFLEGGGDLQMQVTCPPRKRPTVQVTLAKPDGAVKQLPWPLTNAKLIEATGAPLSVREAWRELIAANPSAPHPVFTRVQDGYFLVFAPPAETDADVARTQKETVALLENLTKTAGGPLHLEALRDLEDQRRPISRDTYHDWLPAYAKSIQEGDATAIAAVHPATFMKIVAREAESMGLTATIKAKENEIVLARGPIYVKVPVSGPLIRAVHQGLSFEQGVIPLLEEVNRVRAMSRLHRRVKELVAGRYSTEIFEGSKLRFKPVAGQPASQPPELDLAGLAGKVDLTDDRKAGGDRLARLIGLDPATGRFRDVLPDSKKCACGRPTTPGLKIRSATLQTTGKILAQKEGGVLIAAVVECPDHIRYLKAGETFATFDEAKKAFQAALPELSFPITGVGLIPYRGESLPYAVGQDLPTAALDAGLAASFVNMLKTHFAGRTSNPPLTKLPGAKNAVSLYAPFVHAVVVSPTPIPEADRPAIARLVQGALESPFGRVDPGAPLGFARDLTLDQPARGRYERRAQ